MVHTFHKVPHGAAPGKSAQDGIENMHIVNCIYTEKPAQLKSKLQHTETGSAAVRPQAAGAIAQQYSSVTFASLRFHCRKTILAHI